mmetsp:Transcript_36555/g.53537  ORF Transcript_36555/g.53537 Transcript_36555/m.53537 type:complete len:84 (-) Transcript_36555:456-707(-)
MSIHHHPPYKITMLYLQKNNAVQLIWRLEYDTKTNCLIPTWPVSVITSMYEEGVEFTNEEEFMELGTQYGWNYWQAVVDLENV